MEKWVFGVRMEEGFTPFRRRLSTINTRLPNNDLGKEWTAARCNRLLRALKSRIAILNKDLSRVQSNREIVVEVKAATIRKAEVNTNRTQGRKRIKTTYSSRGGRGDNSSRGSFGCSQMLPAVKETRSFIPGEISVPTPILCRARGELISNTAPVVQYPEIREQDFKGNKRTRARDGESRFHISEALRDIRKQTPASRYTIYEGIYNGLEALLNATIPEEPQKKCGGPRSLLSMCLRTVPRYIAEEEANLAVHMEETGSRSAINTRDISTEVYDDLEAFGSVGRGWKHLRAIVRSHGIQMVSDAIMAGSLEVEFIGILITLCIRTSATKEAETLLSSLLSTVKLHEPKSVFTRFGDELTTRSLSMLWKFVEITGRFSFQYRQLSIMFSDGILPLGWLASKELGSVWTRAIQALSLDSTGTDALMFLDNMLPLLAQTGSQGSEGETVLTIGNGVVFDAMKQTFSSLITTISSIVILSREAVQDTTQNPKTTGYGHFVTLLQSCMIRWKQCNIFNIQGTLLVIANIIISASRHQNPESMNDLIDVLLDQLWQMNNSAVASSPYHDIVTFVCSIARCCGRGASNSGFEHLENLHQVLENVVCSRESDGSNVLREILADSALAFAQEMPDRKHLDYAMTMEAKFHRIQNKPRISSTPRHTMNRSMVGFRWEEGISEWVSATPSMSIAKCKDKKVFLSDQLECETPFRPLIRRRFKKEGTTPSVTTCVLRSYESIDTPDVYDELPIKVPQRESSVVEFRKDSQGETFEYSSEKELSNNRDDSGDVQVYDALEDEPSNNLEDSGDGLISDALEEEPINDFEGSGDEESTDVESADELQLGSPLSNSSDCSKQFDNAIIDSLPRSGDVFLDESFTSVVSSTASHKNRRGRRYIDRVPRLSRRVLRRSLQWQLFDESDDELSFMSVSSQEDSIIQDIADKVGPTRRRLQTRPTAKRQRSSPNFSLSVGDSEDELCI